MQLLNVLALHSCIAATDVTEYSLEAVGRTGTRCSGAYKHYYFFSVQVAVVRFIMICVSQPAWIVVVAVWTSRLDRELHFHTVYWRDGGYWLITVAVKCKIKSAYHSLLWSLGSTQHIMTVGIIVQSTVLVGKIWFKTRHTVICTKYHIQFTMKHICVKCILQWRWSLVAAINQNRQCALLSFQSYFHWC